MVENEESWRKWKIGDFWQKWKAYSLTFSPKYAVFGHFLSLDVENEESWRKWKIGYDFWQKWQAYSLTFSPKYAVFGHFLSLDVSWRKLKKVENGRFLAKMASL